MSRILDRPWVTFGFIVAVAFALRMLAFAFHPELHPDEVYQYVDPATYHIRGIGWQSWEWRDGARSWVLPAYHGAWLTALDWIGLPRGLPQFYFLQIHWALVSSIVWVGLGWWGASRLVVMLNQQQSGSPSDVEQRGTFCAGFVGAVALAAYPPLVPYGPRTLTEVPSAMCLVLSLVATAHLLAGKGGSSRWPLLVGVAASAGVCLRVVNGPVALVPVIWLASKRHWRSLALVLLGALIPLTFFGAVDWATWGKPFFSYWVYIKFNLIDGKSADFGVAPVEWYAEVLWQRAGAGLAVIIAIACFGWRVTWPFVCAGLGLLGYLSLQPHKEERFVLFVWPALLIPAASVLSARWAHLNATERRLWLRGTIIIGLVLFLDGATGITHLNWNTRGSRLMKAQGFVSARPDVTGFLLEENWDGGAYAAFGQDVAMLRYRQELLTNRMFNYVVVASAEHEAQATNAGFKVLRRWDEVVALYRTGSPGEDLNK